MPMWMDVPRGSTAWVSIWPMAHDPAGPADPSPSDAGAVPAGTDPVSADQESVHSDEDLSDSDGGAAPAPSPATFGDAALGFFAGLLASVAFGGVAAAALGTDQPLMITAASLIGLWAGLYWAAQRSSSRRGSGSVFADFGIRFTPGDIGIGLAAGLLVQILVALMYLPFSELNSELSAPARSLTEQAPGDGALILLTVLVVVGAPFIEELFFRGVLLGALRRFGAAIAVLGSAVAFSLVHFGQLLAMPAFVLLGVVLGTLAVRRGRLGAAIVTHATFNAITMAVLLAPGS